MSKNSPKKTLVMGALASGLVLAAGVTFGVKPLLDDASADRDAAQAARTSTTALVAQVADLEESRTQIPAAAAELEELVARFPTTYEQDVWLDLLADTAAKNHVVLSSVDPGLPVAVTPAPSSTASGQDDAGAGWDPFGDGSAQSAAAEEGAAEADQAGAWDPFGDGSASTGDGVAAAGSVVAKSQVTFAVTGNLTSIRGFLAAVESLDRPLVVSEIGVIGDSGSDLTATVVGDLFLTAPLTVPDA